LDMDPCLTHTWFLHEAELTVTLPPLILTTL
jgi:hypothetical protein